MRKRQGYTKAALKAQIWKYEQVLYYKDNCILEDWLCENFATVKNCPVCSYRVEATKQANRDFHGDLKCSGGNVKNCLAIIDKKTCTEQAWFLELRSMKLYGTFNASRVRQILKTRLKYWQRVYAEKYPEKL